MVTYKVIYTGLNNLLSTARDSLARYPLVLESGAHGKVTAIYRDALVYAIDKDAEGVDIDCLEDIDKVETRDELTGDVYHDIDYDAVGKRVDAGDRVTGCAHEWRRVDIQELADWLDAHDGAQTTPAALYDELPDVDAWCKVARLSEPVRDFIECLEELANL